MERLCKNVKHKQTTTTHKSEPEKLQWVGGGWNCVRKSMWNLQNEICFSKRDFIGEQAICCLFCRFSTLQKLSPACQSINKLLFSLSSAMNPYENALIQVVEHMLNERNCNVRNNLVRDELVLILRTRKSPVCTWKLLIYPFLLPPQVFATLPRALQTAPTMQVAPRLPISMWNALCGSWACRYRSCVRYAWPAKCHSNRNSHLSRFPHPKHSTRTFIIVHRSISIRSAAHAVVDTFPSFCHRFPVYTPTGIPLWKSIRIEIMCLSASVEPSIASIRSVPSMGITCAPARLCRFSSNHSAARSSWVSLESAIP